MMPATFSVPDESRAGDGRHKEAGAKRVPLRMVESAYALWTVELVGERKAVDSMLVHIDRYFSCRLHGVGVEIDVRSLAMRRSLRAADGAQLIVGVHDGDQHSLRPHGLPQFVENQSGPHDLSREK